MVSCLYEFDNGWEIKWDAKIESFIKYEFFCNSKKSVADDEKSGDFSCYYNLIRQILCKKLKSFICGFVYNMIEGASEILLEAAFYLYESRVLWYRQFNNEAFHSFFG